MRIRRRNTQQSIPLTVQSIFIVLLSVLCLLVAGWMVITLIRALLG